MSGPWRVGRSCDPRTGVAPLIQDVQDSRGVVVASLGWGDFTDAEVNRHARLIARAPELRDALEYMLAQFGNHPGSTAVNGARSLLDSLEVNEL